MRPLDRRGFLAVVPVLFAGCSGSTNEVTPTTATGPTTTPGGSPAGSPTAADAATVFADGPKKPPERPEEFTPETVREYVREYESRHAYNTLYYGETTTVSLRCDVLSVESASTGYRAVIRCSGFSETRGTTTNSGTATPLHADWGSRRYVYRVTTSETTRRPAGWT